MTVARHGRQVRARGGRQLVRKVRVTAAENGRLARLAAVQGVSVPRLLVESALAEDGWTPTQRRALVRELVGVRRDVEGVATNVNQIAKWANGQQRFPHDAARMLDVVERALEQLEQVVGELRAA